MHFAALNLTTEVTGYQRFLCVCLPQHGAEAELATALDRLESDRYVLRSYRGRSPHGLRRHPLARPPNALLGRRAAQVERHDDVACPHGW